MRRSHDEAPSRGRAVRRSVPVVVAALALIAGCSSGGSDSSDAAAPAPTPVPPVISVEPGQNAKVGPTTDIVVSADRGRLDAVEVKASDGTLVPGTLEQDATVWRSDAKLLKFGTKYDVSARASVDGVTSTKASHFTVKQTKGLRAILSPDERTVGVGMPITVTLTAAPDKRAAVERRLSVSTSKPVVGAWHWFSDTQLHWRPRDFWPADTRVRVKADLKGVKFGKNVYGDHDTSVAFRIGDAQISTVDIANHTMTVTRNGKVVRTLPVTNGEPAYRTRSGIKVIVTKERETIMDSTTVDIPENSSDSYRLKVRNAMRLTWSGEYIHAAPWSVRSQGRANVSHGCTGLSDANAQWLYDFSRVGDVVKYINSDRPLEQGNGYTDWNVPWKTWLAGSALV